MLRESRYERAHRKYSFIEAMTMSGWSRCWETVEARLGFRSRFSAEEGPGCGVMWYRDHVGVHRQKQDGLSYVVATILNGRLTAGSDAFALASLSERFGDGHLRTTIGQKTF